MLPAFFHQSTFQSGSAPDFPKTVVWRHRRENLKKCSLRGLEGRSDLIFLRYPNQSPADVLDGGLHPAIVLQLDAPPLTPADSVYPLLLIDGTWRYADVMRRRAEQEMQQLIPRSLPSTWTTAYPRRQEDCCDPTKGLASVEALFAAYTILGRDTTGLLDHYHWKEAFLAKAPGHLHGGCPL